MADIEGKITLPMAEIPPETKLKNAFRRGGKSKQKHTDKFRTKQNAKVNADIHRGVAERTFEGIDESLEVLKSIRISVSQQQVQVPVATRALGLLTNEIFDFISAVVPRVQQVINIHQFYRVSLMQFAAQQHFAAAIRSTNQDVELADRQDPVLGLDLLQNITSIKKAFSPISHVINAAGSFKHQEVEYLTFLPPLDAIAHDIPGVQNAPRGRRRALAQEIMVPNPYFVSIQNLRESVESLANPVVPAGHRQYFEDFNPIPNAIWVDGLLDNGDEIMPANYFEGQHRRDIAAYRTCLAVTAAKLQSIIGDLNFDGRGNTASLISCYNNTTHLVRDYMVNPAEPIFRAHSPLGEIDYLKGGLSLLGEVPHPRIGLHLPTGYGIRDPHHAVSRMEFSWLGILTAMLQKR